jgi:hypothetical protein
LELIKKYLPKNWRELLRNKKISVEHDWG